MLDGARRPGPLLQFAAVSWPAYVVGNGEAGGMPA